MVATTLKREFTSQTDHARDAAIQGKMFWAITDNQVERVEYMLTGGDKKHKEGELLAGYKVDPNYVLRLQKQGSTLFRTATLLQLAIEYDRPEICALLRQYGATEPSTISKLPRPDAPDPVNQ